MSDIFLITAYALGACGGSTSHLQANGSPPMAGITVAGPPQYRLGTLIHIEGIGVRIIEDRGGAIKGNRIDLFVDGCATAKKFGVTRRAVTILYVPPRNVTYHRKRK